MYSNVQRGIIAGIFAYTFWGLFPVYFKQLHAVAPLEILAWRIVLCATVLGIALLVTLGANALWQRCTRHGDWWQVLAATLLIAINWYVFIVAISVGEILQSSLGYFLVPIVNTALGMIVFGERPNRWKRIAVVVAALGMLITFFVAGVMPWYAFVMALTFGFYGMVRKRSAVESATGLLLETLILAPLALLYLYFAATPLMQWDVTTRGWLLASGVITLLPLLAMVHAAKQIELGTLGFLQYIAPVMHLFIAVVLYKEVLEPARLLAFATTLAAVSLWLIGALSGRRRAGGEARDLSS